MRFFKVILAFAVLVLACSCKDKQVDNVTKLKETVSKYMIDEFFRRNMDLKIIEIQVNKVEHLPMDSLIRNLLTNLVYDPNYYNTGTPEYESLQRRLTNFQNQRELKYKPQDMGTYLKVYLEGTYTDKRNISSNLLYKNMSFWLDSKFEVLDTPFELVRAN